MKRKEIIEEVARGLRRMDRKPDFFLYFNIDEKFYWDEDEILGIPILRTFGIYQGNGENELMFYPLFTTISEDDAIKNCSYYRRAIF